MNTLNIKIYRALRSLFRFSTFTPDYPEILVTTERQLLHKYFSNLSAEEVLLAFQLWPAFYQQQQDENLIDFSPEAI